MAQSDHKSILMQDVQISGTVSFKGELSFDGKFEGNAINGNNLNLGAHATVEGDIQAENVTINGAVTGDVTIVDKCHLSSTAKLQGDLKTARLLMDDGATFIGSCEIQPKPGNVVSIGGVRKAS